MAYIPHVIGFVKGLNRSCSETYDKHRTTWWWIALRTGDFWKVRTSVRKHTVHPRAEALVLEYRKHCPLLQLPRRDRWTGMSECSETWNIRHERCYGRGLEVLRYNEFVKRFRNQDARRLRLRIDRLRRCLLVSDPGMFIRLVKCFSPCSMVRRACIRANTRCLWARSPVQ